MSYSNKVKLKPFSERYRDYYVRCFSNRVNCLEGAFRAGKSVINIYSFANYLEFCQDRIHLVSGASVASARLNVSDCNGLGLSYIFRGRCRTGKHEGNECLFIKTKTGEKIVLFVGGGKSDSYKKIQGLSFGSWLSVELANLYISDDEKCFIDMALSRLTQSNDQKIWWDLNPIYPTHPVYTKYLDRYEKWNDIGDFHGGYNFMRCSLFDNTALSDEERNNFLTNYKDESSMEYRRYILGERALAEGLIFGDFAASRTPYIIDDLDAFCRGVSCQFISIGVDFGGNGSDTTFVATLFYNNYSGVVILRSDEIDMRKSENATVPVFRGRLMEFINSVLKLKCASIRYIWGDCAEPVMINEIRQTVKDMRLANGVRVLDCQKQTIKQRIVLKKAMMAQGRWFVCKEAQHVIDSTASQVWDCRPGHEDERRDDGTRVGDTCIIDVADAEEYSWSAFMDRLIAKKG